MKASELGSEHIGHEIRFEHVKPFVIGKPQKVAVSGVIDEIALSQRAVLIGLAGVVPAQDLVPPGSEPGIFALYFSVRPDDDIVIDPYAGSSRA